MKPGISQTKVPATQFQPGVVIVAEIIFAALLLYLTNHPISVNELTTAENTTVEQPAILNGQTKSISVASTTISPNVRQW